MLPSPKFGISVLNNLAIKKTLFKLRQLHYVTYLSSSRGDIVYRPHTRELKYSEKEKGKERRDEKNRIILIIQQRNKNLPPKATKTEVFYKILAAKQNKLVC